MPTHFNQELLDQCLKRTEARLIEPSEKLTQTSSIKFQCRCGKLHEKQFKRLFITGALCEACMRTENIKKQSEKPHKSSESYNHEVLTSYVEEAGASLIGEQPPLKKEARINFRCKCGVEDSKSFVRIKQTGIYCKTCTSTHRREKRENTNIEKYGNTCTLQNETIKKKSEETCLRKFGTSNVLKSEEVKQRVRNTNLERYGSENPFGSPIIIEKIRSSCAKKYGTEFPMTNTIIRQKVKNTNLERYGTPVSSKASCVKEKAKETNLKIYGKTHHYVPAVIDKINKTNLKKYGAKYTFQSPQIMQKIKETLAQRYGVDHSSKIPGIQTRKRALCLDKYGVSHPLKSKKIQEKQCATNLLRYGVINPSQSLAIQAKAQKTGLHYKNYTTPTGIIRKVQGYEPRALDVLFKEHNLPESDVITDRSHMPVISYSSNNKSHRYFPDIYIPSQRKIIEVKSSWTFELYRQVNCLKWKATIDAGYACEFWIFTKEGYAIMNEL